MHRWLCPNKGLSAFRFNVPFEICALSQHNQTFGDTCTVNLSLISVLIRGRLEIDPCSLFDFERNILFHFHLLNSLFT